MVIEKHIASDTVTGYIAGRLYNLVRKVEEDIDRKRVKLNKENKKTWGLTKIQTTKITPKEPR